MTSINIPPDELNKIISTSILSMISPEKRDEMIKLALQSLIDPQEKQGAYGTTKGKSRLQEAFDNAAYAVARDMFVEEFKNPETKAKLGKLISDAFTKAAEDPDSIEKLAEVFSNVLSGRYRDR